MSKNVLFIHGLWIHGDSWKPWQDLFEGEGYTTFAPGWPGDLESVAATRLDPSGLNDVGVQAVTDHYAEIIRNMPELPIIIGHSFGGLFAQKLLAEGLASASIAISPAPMKGVKKTPFALIKSAFPVISRARNRQSTVALTERQFRYSFGNAVSRDESERLYSEFAIPAPGRPLFEVSSANKFANAPSAVDTAAASGPLLIIASGKDHTVPAVVVREAYERYPAAAPVTYELFSDRGHSAAFDSGWRDLADASLSWLASHALTA
jgi:pimeloyl-ACP methyl ester carboxylesterase